MVSATDNEAGILPYQFLAHASHELRTPLHSVIDTLIQLLDAGLDDHQRQLAASAWHGAGQLQILIEEMFDLSQLESDTLSMNPMRFDLPSLLHSVVKMLTNTARLHGAELQTHWAVPPLRVYGDPYRLQQLIAAVVRTSLRHHPYGAIALVLTATPGQDDSGDCRLQILLNGSRKPLQPDLTSPSWRFAELLATKLDARIDTSGDTGAAQIRVDVNLHAAPDALTGLRVLFVTAHDGERAALLQALRQRGLRADGYLGPANALIALRHAATARDPYRAAIFDEQMQGIDGEMLAHAVLAESSYRDTMLILRGTSVTDDAMRLARAGVAAVLAKPTAPEVLIETLARLCADSPVQTTDPATPAPRGYKGCQVLVIDDHAANRQVMERTLTSLGCNVDTACNGLEAATMQQTKIYDLIIADGQMPELDRYVAAVRTLDGEREEHTPIIGCASSSIQAEHFDYRKAGLDDFIGTPLRPFALRRLLEKWLLLPESRSATTFPPVVDELDAVCAMLGKDFDELATLFIASSPRRIEELRTCIAAHDPAQLAKAAHAFSGSSASIGAHGLSALCKVLELEAHAGKMTQADVALKAVEQEYARIAAQLERMQAALRNK